MNQKMLGIGQYKKKTNLSKKNSNSTQCHTQQTIQYKHIMSHKLRIKRFSTNFVEKLIQLLQEENSQPFVNWTESQNGFNITNVSGFTQHVLPVYFKHQNFSSFVRQLNMYGFTKVRSKDGDHIYQNPNFKRGSKTNLKKVQRRLGAQAEKQQRIVPYGEHHTCVQKTQTQIIKIKERQVNLQKKCVDLIQKNKQLLIENEKIVQAIRQEQKKRQRLISEILEIINSAKPQNNRNRVKAIQSGVETVENTEHKKQQDQHFAQPNKQKGIHFLDPNEQFLTLDDFLNIDCDDISEGLKI